MNEPNLGKFTLQTGYFYHFFVLILRPEKIINDMKHNHAIAFLSIFIATFIGQASNAGAVSYSDDLEKMTYSSRYFGPCAFPMPELHNGLIGDRYEIELRGEYQFYSGDKTTDMLLRVYLPFKKVAALEVSWLIYDHFKMTPETQAERYAVSATGKSWFQGDINVSAMFQVLKNPKIMDILISANIKTASGEDVANARFTDAATYWFDANLARTIYTDEARNFSVRVNVLGGFYCWMTNKIRLRQNDAYVYGAGATVTYRNFTFTTDYTSFHGYKNDGDHPAIWRNKLNYEIKKNIISVRYNHGMIDHLYDTVSLGYIRCF